VRGQILIFLLFANGLIFGQKSFYKNVYLPERGKYESGSQGYKICYLNNSLYSICRSFSVDSINLRYTQYLHFIKCNLNGDTVFTRLVYSDSINYFYISELNSNRAGNGFYFTFTTQKTAFQYWNKISNHIILFDTFGHMVSHQKLEMDLNPQKYSNYVRNILVDDSLYSIVYQYSKSVDTLSSYLVRWNNNLIKDTLLKFNDAIINHRLSSLTKINNNKYVILETQKDPGFTLPYKGRTYIRFYDSNFTLIKTRKLKGYWNEFDVHIQNDTIIILGSNYYSIQNMNNYIIYNITKLNLNGDSLYEWTSRKMKYDTASEFNNLLVLKNRYYICSQKFLFKFQDDSLHILRDMAKILPSNYCFINDSVIGFVGGYKKISNIGIITGEGDFLTIDNKHKDSKGLYIYPNPSNTSTLNIAGINNTPYSIKIINQLEQEVLSLADHPNPQIETALVPGIYFIEILNKGNIQFFKWIVH
jgi:hypothetical protein